MAFDQNTGRLFWAMCNTAREGKLLELDPASGLTFDRGSIAGDAQLIGLHTVIEEVGIVETAISAGSITVYPNPATDILRIARATTDKAQVDIYNSIGVMVLSFEMNGAEMEINVATLHSGMYLVRLIDKQTNSVQRFVKR
jgi:hypothetical protein